MVQLKEENIPIGMCDIIKRNTLNFPDIGFAFLPAYEGKGYAFEIANATLNYAKTTLKLPVIYAITLPQNSKSIALLNKIGMQYSRDIISETTQEVLQLFEV